MTEPEASKPLSKKWTKTKALLFSASVVTAILVVAALGLGLFYYQAAQELPQIVSLADYRPRTITRIYAKNADKETIIGEFFRERRELVQVDKIPRILTQAFVSAEDDTFFEHEGFNPAAILRASFANFKAGHVVQGGSTITQQVTKTLFLTPERNFSRKIKELIMAGRLEKNLTKDQILYLYLNQIYLGSGSYGVQAASETYFHKDISEISLPEAALLAGLPQAPSKYSPLMSPKSAKDRQRYVLRRMYENRVITAEQLSEAAAQPFRVYFPEDVNQKFAPYYVEHVRRFLVEKYGEEMVYDKGLTVRVPSDVRLFTAARNALEAGLRAADKRRGFRGAIGRFDDDAALERFLSEYEEELMKKKVGYQIFTADGKLDAGLALKEKGVRSVEELIEPGEIHKAVVTSVDDAKKEARVKILGWELRLPFEELKWARAVHPDGTKGELPTKVSQVLSPRQMILVQVKRKDEKTKRPDWFASLEQDPEVQGALLSIEPDTGYVLAMEGGYSFKASEFNRAIQAKRQPGSAFKPIIFSLAVEMGYSASSLIVDSPIVYESQDTGKWKPANYDEKFSGDTSFRQALIKSRNVPTIKLVQELDLLNVIQYAKKLGMNAEFPKDLSIALGSASSSLLDLIQTYAVFARLGRRVEPIFIKEVLDQSGQVLEKRTPQNISTDFPPVTKVVVTNEMREAKKPIFTMNEGDAVMDPRVAFVMTHLMQEVVDFGTGVKAKGLGRSTAGKTGTTNDYKDAWFLGFTPHVLTGTWVGFDDQRSLGSGETGAEAALPIWLSFMEKAVKNYPETEFTVPPGIIFVPIDPETGKRIDAKSPKAYMEAYIEGTEPQEKPAGQSQESVDSQSDFLKEDFQ